MSGIDELKILNGKLKMLLDDPQPGLFTWKEILSDILLDIADYAGYGMISETAKKGEFSKTKKSGRV